MSKPHYFSRTAHDEDNRCPRGRFHMTVDRGRGWSPTAESDDLIFGSALHDGVYTIWTTGSVEAAVSATRGVEGFDTLTAHFQYMAECHIRAYALVVYPRLQAAGWRLLAAEKEVPLLVGHSPQGRPLYLLVKPDLILEHGPTGMKRYLEFKSTKLLTPGFLENWRHNVQLAGGQAAYRSIDVDIDAVQVPFFYKGEAGDGYWRSVYTSAWRTPLRISSSTEMWKYSPKRPQSWKGWERFDVHTSGITPKDWVDTLHRLDQNVLSDQMPSTDPLVFDQFLIANWLEQLKFREGEIADYSTKLSGLSTYLENRDLDVAANLPVEERALKNRVFPQNFKQCVPVVGHRCAFYDLCWNEQTAKNPEASGLYKPRIPHHDIEKKALEIS